MKQPRRARREPATSQPVSVTMVKITYQDSTGIPDSAFSFLTGEISPKSEYNKNKKIEYELVILEAF